MLPLLLLPIEQGHGPQCLQHILGPSFLMGLMERQFENPIVLLLIELTL